MIDTLQALPWLFILAAGILGLLVGSFLNVVIYRLPVMMEREWRAQCAELQEAASAQEQADAAATLSPQGSNGQPNLKTFNLIQPRSRCPQCNHAITALENIPVISYLALRGKCSACGASIPWRYPLVELLTAVLSAIVAWQLGFGWAAAAGLVLTWALVALSFIDFDHQLLPDAITLPLLWGGLALSLWVPSGVLNNAAGVAVFADSQDAIRGALAGYLSLWSVYMLFKLVTGKEGMGRGDFKLLALFGAWLGWQALPLIILLSSFLGAVVGVALMVALGRDKSVPIPFGPYLALAGWLSLLWGKQLNQAYWAFMGLG